MERQHSIKRHRTSVTAEDNGATPSNGSQPEPEWWAAGSSAGRPTHAYLPGRKSTRTRPGAFLPALIALAGVAVLIGSRLPWVRLESFGGHRAYVKGTGHVITTAISINGWVTLVGGVLCVVLALLMMFNDGRLLRWATFVTALATAGTAVYATVRILQKIHAKAAPLGPNGAHLLSHARVSYGLVTVLVGAGVAALAAGRRLGSNY
jgi:hypothetical protein